MIVTKAVIPAAGLGTRFLPITKSIPKEMLPIIDVPTIEYIIKEAVDCKIKDILIILSKNKQTIENYFDTNFELENYLYNANKIDELNYIKNLTNLANIYIVRQHNPKGLGDAILYAKAFVKDEPFAVLLGDELLKGENSALAQLMKVANEKNASVLGLHEVKKNEVEKYGIIKFKNNSNLEIEDLVEKPEMKDAPSNLAIMGRYIISPKIFNILEYTPLGYNNELQLTDALKILLNFEKIYGLNIIGKRYDIGSKIGFLDATIDAALERPDLRDEFISLLKEKIKKI